MYKTVIGFPPSSAEMYLNDAGSRSGCLKELKIKALCHETMSFSDNTKLGGLR